MRFLGDVADKAELATVGERMRAADLHTCTATVATTTTTFGRGILVVLVDGLTELAAGIAAATSGLGSQPPDRDARPFNGHLTLARGRGDLRRHRGLPVPGGPFDVTEVTVVTSRLGGGAGPTYDVVARVPVA